MGLDLTGGAVPPRSGTQAIIWCGEGDERLRVAGLPRWKRAVYTACRARFERLLLVTAGEPERLRGVLRGDHRLAGRDWQVVRSEDAWEGPVRDRGGWWVAWDSDWILDEDHLAALADREDRPAASAPDGPFAAPAEVIARWAASGWTPRTRPPEDVRPINGAPSLRLLVRDEPSARAAEDALFEGLARNVTNWFARHVDRAMSRAISRRLARFPVTPNQITVFSTLLGIVGALVMLHPSWAAGALGSLLFLAHTVIDGCDGEIARLKFEESEAGARLDLIGDNVVHAFLFPCMAAHAYFADPDGPFLILGAIAFGGVIVTWIAVYTLVLRSTPSPRLLAFFELFANREFAYLLVVLALAGRLDWFVWAMAFGLWFFPIGLVALALRERRP